jgi:hypothetical protein
MIVLEELVRSLKDNGAVFMKLEDAVAEFDQRHPFRDT